MGAIRAALVNDYEVVAQGLVSMLREYRDAVRVVEVDLSRTVGQPVDITLYDTFAATQGDGEAVRKLAANPLAGKVVVYSWNLDPALVSAALANGATAYVSKSLPARHLVSALQAVHRGELRALAPADGSGTGVRGDWPGREEGLTPREAEVLALITQGLGNAEICERTHLSINSVKTFIRSCYRRIGVTNRSQAILWGIEHGFRPDRARIRVDEAGREQR
ncbi:response regulator transcription factor [Sinomonas atrocyanea]|jgi:DNA-binding NarL/FixJ family response regulator|uniref:response regulator transcription factor n=1 Tax=Sinomonas atrocyanea TaxID=37927 RepID=UPI002783B633|nr:response regulator transcription factor [Sinomonas atrocyanea]MDQ0261140.1 DNA-binding NarL/FixJ family response regulator [Sinomonas atrocyanea]MDR6620468.1 DNA-binding NarL/FixJ family response regulator [Sinomonas atrocyanea]